MRKAEESNGYDSQCAAQKHPCFHPIQAIFGYCDDDVHGDNDNMDNNHDACIDDFLCVIFVIDVIGRQNAPLFPQIVTSLKIIADAHAVVVSIVIFSVFFVINFVVFGVIISSVVVVVVFICGGASCVN